MRTTPDIDDEVTSAARQLAARQGRSVGRFLSDLVRHNLPPGVSPVLVNGVRVLPRQRTRDPGDTMSAVNDLRDDA